MGFDPSTPPAARTALDVAIWFLDRARADDSHLAFQKLHRLLYLAQSLFIAQTGGLLMPVIFLAEDSGPVEPNLQRLLADGRPDAITVEAPIGTVRDFLESVWVRYAHMPTERLNELVARNRAFMETARGHVIDPAAMGQALAQPVLPPALPLRVLRSQSGAPVAVRTWSPISLADNGPATKPRS
jgi:uncharacterized phage-associated protein